MVDDVPLEDTEDFRVQGWTMERLVELGVDPAVALELAATHVDWHRLDKLIRDGCPLNVALRIVA